ncbi:MAG: ATP-binding protein, partial [Paludibacteraceae bacterium]|nr:ATP-binding protein [Paludibacteraceae bacterium]
TIDVKEYDEKVVFDFTVIRFIFYHLIANAVKYIKPKSILSVVFDEDNTNNIVTFSMTSYHIYKEDLDKIYTEGYSGKIAVEQKTAGLGLGMYLVDIMVKLHNAKLVINPGEEINKIGKIMYSQNEFILYIPKQ